MKRHVPSWVKRIYHALQTSMGVRRRICGKNNSLEMHGAVVRKLRVDIEGDGNTVILERGAILEGCSVRIRGNNHRLIIGQGSWVNEVRFFFEDDYCTIEIGQDCWLNKATLSAVETGSQVSIGGRSVIAEEVDIRTSDSHSIVDVNSGERINPPKNVSIGEKVWVGKSAYVWKGARVGAHSVIGARSVVTGEIPPNSLAVGIPARVKRSGVSWKWEKCQ